MRLILLFALLLVFSVHCNDSEARPGDVIESTDEDGFYAPGINFRKRSYHHISCYTGFGYVPSSPNVVSQVTVLRCSSLTRYCIKNTQSVVVPGTNIAGTKFTKKCDQTLCKFNGQKIMMPDGSTTHCCRGSMCNSFSINSPIMAMFVTLLASFYLV